jgi:putative DNA primase/helicase
MDHFKRYMVRVKVPERVAIAAKTGWHSYKGSMAFVNSNDREIKDDSLDQIILAEGVKSVANHRGSLADWNHEIGSIVRQHRLLTFGLCVALCGPFLHILGLPSFLAHIYGHSTIGKTTLAKVATSVWGNWAEGGAASPPTWNTTLAALEVQLRNSNDMFMVLDELSLGAPQVVDDAAYMIAGGGGKARSQSKGGLRDTEAWRVPVLSTGELSISETIRKARNRYRSDGASENAGQGVRALDIPIRAIFEGDAEGATIAKLLSEATKKFHGAVGRQLVKVLREVGFESVQSIIAKGKIKFIGDQKWNSEVSRVADIFATIAAVGEFAIQHVVGSEWIEGTSSQATEHVFKLWVGEGSEDDRNVPHTKRQFLEAVRRDIYAYWGSKYWAASEADMSRPITTKTEDGLEVSVMPQPVAGGECYGYRMKEGDVVVTPSHFEDMCRLVNIDKKDGIKYLQDENLLVKGRGRESVESYEPQTWIPRLDHSVYWVRISKRVFGEAIEADSTSNVVHLPR